MNSALAATRLAEQRWWLALAMYAVIGVIAVVRYSGPAARSSDEASGVSAGRAFQTLALVLGEEQKPHRAGTQENDAVRVRIQSLLDELGVETQLVPFEPSQEGLKKLAERKLDLKFTHPLTTIVGRLPGKQRSRPVVIASHYDGAIESPGAGDAGQCVAAILETIRVLQAEPLEYETWILLTDAEEFGLWGAQAFIDQARAPWGSGVPLVINFDARGDRGAALLYETHENNLAAMHLARRAIGYPRVSTSLMVNVYKRLPNGTDFTVFRKAGWCGWNFAVVAGADRYHTPNDSLENLSLNSVQHFASHAYQLLRHLDQLTPDQLSQLDHSEPAVFFDLLGFVLLVYPMQWNTWHLIVITLLWLASWRGLRSELRAPRVLAVLGLSLSVVLVAYGLGWIIVRGLQAADLSPRNFVAGYELVVLVYAVLGIALMFGVGRWVARPGRAVEVHQATVACYVMLSALTWWLLPGGAYLFLWPATGLVAAGLLHIGIKPTMAARRSELVLLLLGCVIPALLYAPTYVLLAQTLGPRAGMLIAALVVVMLMPTLVAFGQRTRD